MSDLALESGMPTTDLAKKAVNLSTRTWFVAAALGHWIFLVYILAVFYPPIATEGLDGLRGMHLPAGFREGEFLGNLAAASHVLLAAVIIGGGPLQLVPAIRSRFPAFHRWLGRSYLVAAVLSAIAGLYMVWTRGTVGGLAGHLGITLDGVLILVFAAFALRYALARRIREHRRWALRLFMAASAVWFFRVGMMGWVMLTGGAGVDFETFTGPFLTVLGFAQYLLPLAMLEWYFRCQARPSGAGQWLYVVTLGVLTAYMCVGIFAAAMGLWLPRL